jgi:hypothetical protein
MEQYMTEANIEVDEKNDREEKDVEDSRWIYSQLQQIVDLAALRDCDRFNLSLSFLMFANGLNRDVAPNTMLATSFSLSVLSRFLQREGDELLQSDEGDGVDGESKRLEQLSGSETLH